MNAFGLQTQHQVSPIHSAMKEEPSLLLLSLHSLCSHRFSQIDIFCTRVYSLLLREKLLAQGTVFAQGLDA